jgi:hypothetical protein
MTGGDEFEVTQESRKRDSFNAEVLLSCAYLARRSPWRDAVVFLPNFSTSPRLRLGNLLSTSALSKLPIVGPSRLVMLQFAPRLRPSVRLRQIGSVLSGRLRQLT